MNRRPRLNRIIVGVLIGMIMLPAIPVLSKVSVSSATSRTVNFAVIACLLAAWIWRFRTLAFAREARRREKKWRPVLAELCAPDEQHSDALTLEELSLVCTDEDFQQMYTVLAKRAPGSYTLEQAYQTCFAEESQQSHAGATSEPARGAAPEEPDA